MVMSMKGLFSVEVLGVGDLKGLFLAGDLKIEVVSGVSNIIMVLFPC